MSMGSLTKESLLEEIPTFSHGGETKIRPDFRELWRVIKSQKLSAADMEFLLREIVARKKRLGFDD